MTSTFKRCVPVLAALVGASGALSGCAGMQPAIENENRRLEVRVAELRAQSRRDRQKIRDFENQIRGLEERLARGDGGWDEPLDVPELPVEVVAPEPAAPARARARRQKPRPKQERRAAAEPTAPASPPPLVAGVDDDGVEIIYEGEALRGDPVRPSLDAYDLRGQRRSEPAHAPTTGAREPLPDVPEVGDRLAVTEGAIPPITDTRQARAPRLRQRSFDDPRAEYRRYYEALRNRDHAAAIAGFRNFVERFPGHEYADNAQYWLGEAFYDQRRFRAAIVEFQRVLEDYPRGNKVPDALLKIGYSHDQLGDKGAARTALRQVIERFPKSNPASLAARKLEQLEESR